MLLLAYKIWVARVNQTRIAYPFFRGNLSKNQNGNKHYDFY